MEIVYDEGYNVRFRLDDGRELALAAILADLEKVEKLETALTLTRTSREWNRKRVVELEDALERGERKASEDQRLYTAAEHRRSAAVSAAPLRRRVAELERALAASVNRENRLESDAADTAAEHRRSLAARDHLLSAATTRMNAVREILLARTVAEARDQIVTSKGAILADAIGNALNALEG